jgi:hypothetical protein
MMATAVNQVKKTKKDAFHTIFEPSADGCSGSCNYMWDNTTKEYVLCNADSSCSGADCQPCAKFKPSIVRQLVILEGSFPDPDAISHACGGTTEDSLNSLLGLFVDLLKRYKLLVKFTVGLGLVSAALLIAVIYLLVR